MLQKEAFMRKFSGNDVKLNLDTMNPCVAYTDSTSQARCAAKC